MKFHHCFPPSCKNPLATRWKNQPPPGRNAPDTYGCIATNNLVRSFANRLCPWCATNTLRLFAILSFNVRSVRFAYKKRFVSSFTFRMQLPEVNRSTVVQSALIYRVVYVPGNLRDRCLWNGHRQT